MLKFDLDSTAYWIADAVTPRDLLRVAKTHEQWTNAHLRTLDHVLCQWTEVACARQSDRTGLSELQGVTGRLTELATGRATSMDVSGFVERWQAFRDVLETHRITLAARDPEAVMRRKHVPELMKFLATLNECEQGALREHLAISEARLAQLLSLVESHGLIERRKEGRINKVWRADQRSSRLQTQSKPVAQTEAGPRTTKRFLEHMTHANSDVPKAA